MILSAYGEALGVSVGEDVTSGYTVYTRGEWAVIRGTDGMLEKTEAFRTNISNATGTTRVLPVPFLDGATASSDPNRTKTVHSVWVYNADIIAHVVNVGIDNGTFTVFRTFTLPAGGSVTYHDKSGWDLRAADGRTLDRGADGANGTNGTNGTDGWTYVKLSGDTASNSVTLADVTGMNFSASADTNYEVEVFGRFTSAATTTGMALALTVPTGGTVAGLTWHPSSATALSSALSRATGAVTGATTGVDAVSPNAVPFLSKFMVLNANTAGTVQLQLRSEIAASAVTLLGGSVWLKYRTIA